MIYIVLYFTVSYEYDIVLCFTESKQAICSHRICKQTSRDLSSQPKLVYAFLTIPYTFNQPL